MLTQGREVGLYAGMLGEGFTEKVLTDWVELSWRGGEGTFSTSLGLSDKPGWSRNWQPVEN